MTVTDPYTGIGVITRGVFDSDMAAISLSLHSSCNDIALNEKNSPSFCQIHFYRGIFHLLSSCTLSTLRAFNSSSFHPSSPQIHPFSMIPVTPQMPRRVKVFSCRASACPFLGILPGKKLREIREDKTFGEEHETQRDRSSRFGTVETASGEDAPFRDAGKDGMPERGLDSVPFRVWNKSAYY